MSNPWIFTNYTPTESERISLSLHHLLLMWAYEIYINHTRTQFPEESDQLILNRQYLHLNKKYDPDSDEIQEFPKINFHDYHFPFPNYKTIDEIYILLENNINQWKEEIIWKDINFNLKELRCGVDFRKYLFGYIKWISWNKELKQKVVNIKDFSSLYNTINTHF